MTDLLERPSTRPAPPAPSRRVRRAWLVPGVVLALASLVWGTINVVGLVAHGHHATTSTFDAADVRSLLVENDNGRVTVVAGDASGDATIVVTADVDDGWRATEVSAVVVDGVLQVRGGCPFLGSPWCNVDFTVSVPAELPVTVRGSDGSIRVSGVTADLDVSVGNGSIELDDVAASLRAASDNGRITGRRLTSPTVDASTDNGSIMLSFLDPPRSVRARSANGSLDVVVPDDVGYRVDARSDNGSADTTVRTDPSSEYVIDVASDNGSVRVRPPD